MNLNLLKKNEPQVKTSEKHPTIPVITLFAENSSGSRTSKMIKFNINAMMELGIGTMGREDFTKIILFDEYLVSSPEEKDRYDLCMFVTNQKYIKTTKKNKSYDVAIGTRKLMSSDIYDSIATRFNLDTTKDNYIQLIPTDERTGGGYSLSLIEENVEKKTINIFDKGENVEVNMTEYN